MKRIYIAGPMTGLPDLNYPAFDAAAAQLRAAGHHVENPAENPPPPCGTWLGYMRMAIPQLASCDAVHMLPGWKQSRGAKVEHTLAIGIGLDICYQDATGSTVDVAHCKVVPALQSFEDLSREWMCEFKPLPAPHLDAAREYTLRCEVYDRTVCTGPVGESGVLPATDRERSLITLHASRVRSEILQREHLTPRQFNDAVHAYTRSGADRDDLAQLTRKQVMGVRP